MMKRVIYQLSQLIQYKQLKQLKQYKRIFILFIVMNILYTVIGYTAWRVFPHNKLFGTISITDIKILDIFTRWDGMHYNSIACDGYGVYNENNIAFFPLFPLIIRILYKLSGIRPVYWGLAVSRICFLIALIVLYDLIRQDYDEKISYRTLLYLVIFPASFYFISLYTESLFLLLILLSFKYGRKGKWLTASLFAMLSTAVRSVGIFMLPVLLTEYLYKNKWKVKSLYPAITVITVIPLGLLAFMGYLYFKEGDPLAFKYAQKAYSRHLCLPGVPILMSFKNLLQNLSDKGDLILIFQFFREFFTGLMFFTLMFFSYKKIRPSYWIYAFLVFILPFSTAVGNEGLSGMPRYVLIIFPFFLILSKFGSNKKFHYAYISASFLTGILLTGFFSCWYWVA